MAVAITLAYEAMSDEHVRETTKECAKIYALAMHRIRLDLAML